MPECRFCDKKLPEEARFCSECGRPVGTESTHGNVKITRKRSGAYAYAFVTDRKLPEDLDTDSFCSEVEDAGVKEVEEAEIESDTTLVVRWSSVRIKKEDLDIVESIVRACFEEL